MWKADEKLYSSIGYIYPSSFVLQWKADEKLSGRSRKRSRFPFVRSLYHCVYYHGVIVVMTRMVTVHTLPHWQQPTLSHQERAREKEVCVRVCVCVCVCM